jgi:hypothetical protein
LLFNHLTLGSQSHGLPKLIALSNVLEHCFTTIQVQ